MRPSLESSRAPILETTQSRTGSNATASHRHSFHSSSASMAATEQSFAPSQSHRSPVATPSTSRSNATAFDTELPRELRIYSTSLARLESKRLQEQRYTISAEKLERMQSIAMLAKKQRGPERGLAVPNASTKRHSIVATVDPEKSTSTNSSS